MRKDRISIPKPKTAFILIQCSNCGAEHLAYSGSATNITCRSCGAELVRATGGRALIMGTVVKRVD